MPIARIQLEDGRIARFEVPEGTTPEQVMALVKPTLGGAVPAPAPSPVQPEGRPSSAADLAASAMTFGLTNDVSGAVRALGPMARFVGNKMGFDVPYKEGEIGDAYRSGRDAAIKGQAAYRDANPVTAFGADVMGGIANPISRLALPVSGASMAQKALQGAKIGAGTGAAYGFGTAPGDLWDRAEGAAGGGLVGGAVGAVAPPLIEGVSSGLRTIADQIIGRMGATNQQSVAARKVAEALIRDGYTPEQAAAKLAQMGPEAIMADLGQNARNLAGAISRIPGEGASNLTARVTARQEGVRDAGNVLSGAQSQRVMTGVDGLIPDNVDATLKSAAAQRMRAGANYEAAKAEPINNLVDIAPIVKSLDDEIASSKGGIRTGLDRVKSFLVDSKGNPEVTIDALHQAKMAIDDLMSSGEGRNSMGRVAQQRIKDYQTQLLNAIETSGPAGAEYAKGRGATAAAWRTQDALESGMSFMSKAEFGGSKQLSSAVAKMSDEERNAFRMGAAQAIKNKLADLNVRADATKRVMDIPVLEEKIKAAFGDADTFRRYIDMLKNERQMFDTYVELTKGSQTAARQQANADLARDPGSKAQAVMDIVNSPRNPMSYLRAGLRLAEDAKTRAAIPEPVRNQIAAMMIGRNAQAINQPMTLSMSNEAMRNVLARGLLSGGTAATVPGLLAPPMLGR